MQASAARAGQFACPAPLPTPTRCGVQRQRRAAFRHLASLHKKGRAGGDEAAPPDPAPPSNVADLWQLIQKQNTATKEDMQKLATKEDLQQLATKEDLQQLKDQQQTLMGGLYDAAVAAVPDERARTVYRDLQTQAAD